MVDIFDRVKDRGRKMIILWDKVRYKEIIDTD